MADIYSIKNPADNGVNDIYCIGEGYGTCVTQTSASGARSVLLQGYKAVRGFVAVRFSYDVPSGATMNINNTTAYPIRRNGSSITSGIIKGGDIAMFYFDGLYYNLVGVDNRNALDNVVSNLYDWYSVYSSDDVKTEGNTKYLLICGDNGNIFYDTLENGTRITLDFNLQDGVQGLMQAGLTYLNIKLEETTGSMTHIAEASGNPYPTANLIGAKSITADYNSSDGVFYLSSVIYDVTDTASSGSNDLITSGGVYAIVGDIESALDAIINGASNGGRA